MKCGNLSLKAIYSRSLKSAQDTAALYDGPEPTPDLYSADSGPGRSYDDLLAREDIAAVILALPIMSQPTHIEAALTAGKHVLAEKPLAPTVEAGKKLLDFYRRTAEANGATFAVAENFRFKPSFEYAAAEAAKVGSVQQFNVRVLGFMGTDTKWYGTAWRAKPEYQGGFLLDGGVHFAAATRMMLPPGERAADVSAQTAQAQPHLPPIDTVSAVVRLESGVSGVYQQSAGSRLSAFDFDFSYERGTVSVSGDKVTVKTLEGGAAVVKEFGRTSGVGEEVEAWGKSLVEGKPDERQSVEKALGDLEFLEQMFESGSNGGEVRKYEHQ